MAFLFLQHNYIKMKNPAVKYGLIYAVSTILLSLVLIYTNPGLVVNYVTILPIFGLFIFFFALACREYRKKANGTISYGECIKIAVQMILIGFICSILFNYLLYNFISPDLEDVIKEHVITNTENMYDGLVPVEELDKIIEDMENNFEMNFAHLSIGGLTNAFFLFIISLIASVFLKKNPPMGGALDNV